MSILALDLGTKCGYACSSGVSGVWDLTPTRFESSGQRFSKFKYNLENTFLFSEVTSVVFEEVRAHMGVDAAHCYGGFLAILQTLCLEAKIEYRGIGVKTIKKHATGNGNADKKKMIDAAIIKFKRTNIIDSNHADALWLLDLTLSQGVLTIRQKAN